MGPLKLHDKMKKARFTMCCNVVCRKRDISVEPLISITTAQIMKKRSEIQKRSQVVVFGDFDTYVRRFSVLNKI